MVDNRSFDSFSDEGVPVAADDRADFRGDSRIQTIWDLENSIEFRLMAGGVESDDIGPVSGERVLGGSEAAAIAMEDEDFLVNVVFLLGGLVSTGWFGSPDLGRDVNFKYAGGGGSNDGEGGNNRQRRPFSNINICV